VSRLAGSIAPDTEERIHQILNRHPSVGLAVGVARNGRLEFFGGGLADIASASPVTEDTVFRIASITKTFTAIAVMQLVERGLVDLDAPANDYLHAYKLIPARPGFRPATPRHLLTHTAGIREVLKPSGLLRMRDLGETVRTGRRVPTLAEYYAPGLRVDAEPGSRFMYTDHGFATLGQIVEDVSGQALGSYMKEHIFEPLGMSETDLLRPQGPWTNRATGYELTSRGAEAIPDYDVITVGGGGISSTPRDMGAYLAALLGGGANEHGSVLRPETLATMFRPHYQPDPRLSGLGLAFFRADLGGHLVVEHDGILPGFDSQIMLAPEDGFGVMAFANGARRDMHWLTPEMSSLMCRLLEVPEAVIRTDVPHHPEIWGELRGWYRLSTHPTDPARFALGAGAEVFVKDGRPHIRFLSPIPVLFKGLALHPDDAGDPYVFRVAFPGFGVGTVRVVFSRAPRLGVSAVHLDFGPLSLAKRPARSNPRRWGAAALGALGLGTVAAVIWLRHREPIGRGA
jgi:CubicO group peptidase (beta-lactamase class C family)